MRATGIVRRTDDLGRIVIPKELRKAFNIREGDPLEVFVDHKEGCICFKPYKDYSEPWRLLERVADIVEFSDFHNFRKEICNLAERMKKSTSH